jgi:hypothetical protein
MIPYYYYQKNNVVLFYVHEAEQFGLYPISEENEIGCYLLDKYVTELIKQRKIEPLLTYDDSYSGYADPDDIIYADVVNIENDQRLINVWCRSYYAGIDLAERELCVTTNGYFDWTSERSQMIDKIDSNMYELSELKKEWNNIVNRYKPYLKDLYQDYSFESLLEESTDFE